jgi:hypothetical protein
MRCTENSSFARRASAKAQENLAGVRVVRAYVQRMRKFGFDAPNREYIDRNLRLIFF